MAVLPNAEATAAQVRVTTPSGCWTGSSGVADLRTQAPVPANARFRIGSVTKVFTATVVLNHTDGRPSPTLPDDIEWSLAHRYDRWTPEAIVRQALRNPREFDPGTKQHYTNMGYIVAGMLIEKITGHPYASEIQQRISGPLGLRDTYVPGDDPTIRGPHTQGYRSVTRDGVTSLVDVTKWSQTITPASGDMISTLADLDTFLRRPAAAEGPARRDVHAARGRRRQRRPRDAQRRPGGDHTAHRRSAVGEVRRPLRLRRRDRGQPGRQLPARVLGECHRREGRRSDEHGRGHHLCRSGHALSPIAGRPAGRPAMCAVVFYRLRAVMSPWVVVAWMSSSGVPSFLSELLTRP
ncbi:beta-lactamase family protein [Actinoplanes sp. TBRC 11911]|nr:beta-lactamase family protein [Actinoplanes sp. TBRC 11911]